MKAIPALIVALLFSSVTYAEIISKRDFIRHGKPWVEETHKDPNGRISIVKRPKDGSVTVKHTSKRKPYSSMETRQLPSGDMETTSRAGDGMINMRVKQTQSRKDYEAGLKEGRKYANAISSCDSSYQASLPHPLVQGFTAQRRIHGIRNGKCKYTETMPNNGLMTCLYSSEDRQQFRGLTPNDFSQKLNQMMQSGRCTVTGY